MNELAVLSDAKKINVEPKFVHGRLAEAIHNAGYSFERACRELEWLLEDGRWKECGQGFERIDDFLATVDFSEFKIAIEQRKKLAKRLTDLRATQRAVGSMLGVDHATIHHDISGENSPNSKKSTLINTESGENSPSAFDHSAKDTAELLDKKTSQIVKKEEHANKIKEIQNNSLIIDKGPFRCSYN